MEEGNSFGMESTEFMEIWKIRKRLESIMVVFKHIYDEHFIYELKLEQYTFTCKLKEKLEDIDKDPNTVRITHPKIALLRKVVSFVNQKKFAILVFFAVLLLSMILTSWKSQMENEITRLGMRDHWCQMPYDTRLITEHKSLCGERISAEEIDYWKEQANEYSSFIKPEDSDVRRYVEALFYGVSKENPSQEEWLKRAETIYSFIHRNMEYEPEPPEQKEDRKEPSRVLEERKGDCEDFAFLFVSMAVAAGVPPENIRIVFACLNYCSCQDTLDRHTYVEICFEIGDRSVWMPVEVTPTLSGQKPCCFDYFLHHEYKLKRRYYWVNGNKEYRIFEIDEGDLQRNVTYVWSISTF